MPSPTLPIPEMSDPSTLSRTPSLTMARIRERLAGRVPHAASLDSSVGEIALAPDARSGRAAVALIIRADAGRGPEILFIRRAEHPQDPWSGHMAFPGGREEPSDGNLLQTAYRETREEVALDLAIRAELIGQLDGLPAIARGQRTGLTISPFVFELRDQAELTLNGEVAEAVWAPLEPLFTGERATTFPYDIAGQHVELPAHEVAGRLVWGLTHRMLEGLFALLR